jgi:hypothetical protein
LGVYKVHGTIKKKIVANVVQAEMQHCHLYIACHVVRATNVATSYRTKHKIVDNDMVYGFHFI